MSYDDRFRFDRPTAEAVGEILIEEIGLTDDRDEVHPASLGYRTVVRWLTDEGARGGECRLSSKLGFGAKLWVDWKDPAPRVNCYREDETLQRLAMIERANQRLAGLFAGRPLADLLEGAE